MYFLWRTYWTVNPDILADNKEGMKQYDSTEH